MKVYVVLEDFISDEYGLQSVPIGTYTDEGMAQAVSLQPDTRRWFVEQEVDVEIKNQKYLYLW